MYSSNSSSSPPPDPSRVWIYHERQESLLCGQHALNNLLQSHIFDAGQLSEVAQTLDALERNYLGVNSQPSTLLTSNNVDERGNFSIQVLKQCMDQYLGMSESLPHYSPTALASVGVKDVTELTGFLCHKSDHWFAIRKIAGRFFNLNSTLKRPQVVSHFHLGKEMDHFASQGYTVFYVASPNLPELGHLGDSPPLNDESAEGHWFRMVDLLKQEHSVTEDAKDPWQSLTGRGMRLDGKQTTATKAISNNANPATLQGMTEEEQLQFALLLSQEQETAQRSTQATVGSDTAKEDVVLLAPEPEADDPNSCRIQFRWSNGPRQVRRFHKHDTVASLYVYIKANLADGTMVELRAGFPPQNLDGQMQSTLEQAGLAKGESIQVRLL